MELRGRQVMPVGRTFRIGDRVDKRLELRGVLPAEIHAKADELAAALKFADFAHGGTLPTRVARGDGAANAGTTEPSKAIDVTMPRMPVLLRKRFPPLVVEFRQA